MQRFEYADGRMPVAMTQGGEVYYLAYDQVGSLRIVTDAVGTVVKRIEYDSFGNILSDSDPSFSVPFGFAGGLHDRDTGLVRFGARDYDPATGKWTAKDPIDFAGGDLNLLSYTGQDPVNWVDIWGLIKFKSGVTDKGLRDLMKNKYTIFDEVYKAHAKREAIITSTTDGNHKTGSLHYKGLAIDLRGNDISNDIMRKIADELQKKLGNNSPYQVIAEFYPDDPANDHIHIEYDIKSVKPIKVMNSCPFMNTPLDAGNISLLGR